MQQKFLYRHRRPDADTGMIVAQVLNDQHTDDSSQVGPLFVETSLGRYKSIIGHRLRARRFEAQQTEAAIGVAVLNRMLAARRPNSVRSQKVPA